MPSAGGSPFWLEQQRRGGGAQPGFTKYGVKPNASDEAALPPERSRSPGRGTATKPEAEAEPVEHGHNDQGPSAGFAADQGSTSAPPAPLAGEQSTAGIEETAAGPTGFTSMDLAQAQEMGRDGDSMLAHINPDEAYLLYQMGGSGGTNPFTGLPEFRRPPFQPMTVMAPIVGSWGEEPKQSQNPLDFMNAMAGLQGMGGGAGAAGGGGAAAGGSSGAAAAGGGASSAMLVA